MKYFLACLCFFFIVISRPAQGQYNFNFEHNFCPISTLHASANFGVYADSTFFISCGNTVDTSSNSSSTLNLFLRSYIASFDYSGNLLWKKSIVAPGDTKFQGFNNIVKLGHNKYAVAGNVIDTFRNTYPHIDNYQPYLYMFNQNGDSLGFNTWVDSFQSRYIRGLTFDGAYLYACGYISSKTMSINSFDSLWYPDSIKLWVAKFDTIGHMLWEHQYFNAFQSSTNNSQTTVMPMPFKIIPSHDRKHIIIAMERSLSPGTTIHSYITELDTSGNIAWSKPLQATINTFSDFLDIIPNSNSAKYTFVGTKLPDALSPSVLPDTLWMYYGQFDENGDTLWTKKFVPPSQVPYRQRQGTKVIEMHDGSLLFEGTCFHWDYYGCLFKTDTAGNPDWYREIAYYPLQDTTSPFPDQHLYSLDETIDHRILMSGYIDSVPNSDLSWFVMTDSLGCNSPGCNGGDTIWHITGTPLARVKNSEIKVWPNPMNNELYISGIEKGTKVELYDMIGRLMFRETVNLDKAHISTKDVVPGNYILKVIHSDGAVQVRKLLKD